MDASEPSNQWNLGVAKILSAFHDEEQLAQAILEAVCIITPADLCSVAYHSDGLRNQFVRVAPTPFLDDLTTHEELWHLDPFYQALLAGGSGVMPLRSTMPRGFENSAYFEQVYTAENITDELLHVVQNSNDRGVVVSLLRYTESGNLLPEEIDAHQAAHPVLLAAAFQLGELLLRSAESANKKTPRESKKEAKNVVSKLDEFGSAVLTPLEQEVIRLVLRGHNSESIAETLNIAVYTVKMHRKNAYAKLHINSQGDLFSQFLETIGVPPK